MLSWHFRFVSPVATATLLAAAQGWAYSHFSDTCLMANVPFEGKTIRISLRIANVLDRLILYYFPPSVLDQIHLDI